MMKFGWMQTILGVLFLLFPVKMGHAGEKTIYAFQETRDLVALVEEAAAAIQQEGEKVFPDFRKEGGRWFQGDRYVFVWDLKGNRYVFPPDLAHERQNLIDLKDIGGKPIGKMFLAAAANKKGRGWVQYQWNKPHELEPLWKSTYILRTTSPSGNVYLVGSGIYQARIEKAFIVNEVEAASDLLQREGRDAFVTLRDPKTRFFFHDTYMFVLTEKGIELVNPAFPALEGRNLWDIQDINGKYIVREFTEMAQKKGEGWVIYYWPKPDAPQIPIKKSSFVKKILVDKEPLIIGAGMYD